MALQNNKPATVSTKIQEERKTGHGCQTPRRTSRQTVDRESQDKTFIQQINKRALFRALCDHNRMHTPIIKM
jgi:hypothetical protein